MSYPTTSPRVGRATSGSRATYGPQSNLMWPASHKSFLNSYFDYESTLNIKKNHKTTLISVYMNMYWPEDT
jgi:hypothetical protein